MFYWIYDVETLPLALLFSAVSVGFTWAGVLLTRSRVRRWLGPQPGHNDIVGIALSAYGVFYGIMVGLIAVGTYENFSQVEGNVGREASCLNSLYRDVSGYPEPVRTELKARVRDYVHHIVDDAWPEQRRGLIPTGGTPKANAIQEKLLAFEPATKGQEILHAETLGKYGEMGEMRRLRLQSVTSGLPVEMWGVVVVGALLNIVLTWMLSLEKLSVHLAVSGILALFVGLVLFLVAAMDNPFRGTISVSPEPFEMLLKSWSA